MFSFCKIRLAALSLCAAMTGVAWADAPKEINFGIISTESSQNLRTMWDPFLEDMSRQTGLKVNAFFSPDYAGIIQGMRFDKVDIAWYGNKSAMEAVDRAGGEVMAQTVSHDGQAGYWSLLIAHKDSPYDSVEDVLQNADKIVFANGDPNSTSGYLVPGYYVFARNGVDPVRIFKRTLNSNHEANGMAVANRQVDVATISSETMERLEKTQPAKHAQLKIIWRSPLIPSDPIVWRKNLDAATKEKISAFLFGYGKTAREKEVLTALLWAPFRVSDNDQLIPVRQLELFRKRALVENDTSLSVTDRAAKIAALDAELERLNRRLAERDVAAGNAG